MASRLITTTPRAAMDPQRYQGILVADSYAQLNSSISKTLSPEHALFFAEPAQDASGEAIDWYTEAEGPLTNLMDLPPERLEAAEAKIQSLASSIEVLAQSLCESQEPSKKIRGNILQLALRYPGREYIFMAGDQPVLTGWGFAPATAGAQVEELIRFGHAAPRPAPMPAEPVQEPAAVAAAPAVPPAKQSEKAVFDWKRALLALLAGLLILLALYFLGGLLFGGAGCSVPGMTGSPSAPAAAPDGGGSGGSAGGSSGGTAAPGGSSGGGCAASLPAMGGCANTPPPVAAPQLSSEGLRELQAEQEKALSLQRRIEELQRQLALRATECPREQPKEDPPVPEEPPTLADLLPTTPEPEPEPEPAPVPPKKPEKPKQPEQPKQPEKPKSAKGQDMEIPKDAAKNNDLSFLEGCWTSETGLHNSSTGEPIVVTYCFDANGGGTRTINGQEKGDRCVGPVRAKFQGQNLVMNADGASCNKGNGYYGQDVNCAQGANNKAQCTGKERDRKRTTWKARFRRN